MAPPLRPLRQRLTTAGVATLATLAAWACAPAQAASLAACSPTAEHTAAVQDRLLQVASVLRKNKGRDLGKSALTEIWRHPIHTREFGSQITNVLRCLQLEAHGYQVNVTELVGWEHSMKNELIIATYKNLPRRRPTERLQEVLQTVGLEELGNRFYAEQAQVAEDAQ